MEKIDNPCRERVVRSNHRKIDRVLFRDGALALADLASNAVGKGYAFPALSGHVAVLVPAAMIVGILPLTALIASMAHVTRERPADQTAGAATLE